MAKRQKKQSSKRIPVKMKMLLNTIAFFDKGYKVFFMPFKLAAEAKQLKLKCKGVFAPRGYIVLENSDIAVAFRKDNHLDYVQKELYLTKIEEFKVEKKEKREIKINKKHGLGSFTNKELEDVTIQIKTSDDKTFSMNASKQRKWMLKNKREHYMHKTDAEQMFIDCFTEKMKSKYFRIEHEIILEGHTFFFDYYLRHKRVCVEIDGGYHKTITQKKKDKERDSILLRNGIKTLRIQNEDACIKFPQEFCTHPFSIHKDRYDIFIDVLSAGIAYVVTYHNRVIKQNSFLTDNGESMNRLCEILYDLLVLIPDNSVVIVKCPRNNKLQQFIKNSKYKNIFKDAISRFFEFDIMLLSPKSNNEKFKEIRNRLKKLASQKKQNALNTNNSKKQVDICNNKAFNNIKQDTSKDIKSFFNSTDIVRVYINASAMKSADKQKSATGVAYGIYFPNSNNPRISHTCLNGFNFSCHSAILFGIVRMVTQYVPENAQLLILTTDSNCISLNKENRKKPKVGLEYIAQYDKICEQKNINAHVHILNHVTTPQYIEILNIARNEAKNGLATSMYFEPSK